MAPLIRRLHLFEINDQSWFPDFLRQRVQACLSVLWIFKIPVLQPCSPASLVAQALLRVLGSRSSDYTYVDFCSGAGGPTLAIEEEFNARLAAGTTESTAASLSHQIPSHSSDNESLGSNEGSLFSTLQTDGNRNGPGPSSSKNGQGEYKTVAFAPGTERPDQAIFVLTDIAPSLSAWSEAAKQSPRIRYVAAPIDAAAASITLLSNVEPTSLPLAASRLPIFRLFSLAFHHFDDPLAEQIIANTIDTSAGFAILELQGRNFASLLLTALLFPLMLLISPILFWNDPLHLLFTYIIPVIPFVVSFDGIISSLRTRTGEEVKAMVDEAIRHRGGDIDEWDILWGSEWHTWPLGEMSWIVGLKKADGKA